MTDVKLEIEIGKNLAETIQAFVKEVGKTTAKKGESIGAEVQRAFGVDISKIAKEKILMDAALERGLDIVFEND